MNEENTITIDKQSVGGFLDGVIKFLLLVSPVVVFLVFSPISADTFDLPKGIIMFILSGLLFVAYLLKSALSGKLEFVNSIFNIPVSLFALSSLLSALVPVNKLLGLSDLALGLLPMTIIYFAVANSVSSEDKLNKGLTAFGLAAMFLAIINIVTNVYTLIGKLATGLPSISYLTPLFSPTGSVFAQLIFYAIALPVIISQLKEGKSKALWGSSLILVIISALFSLNTVLANHPVVLDLQASWKIATGALGSSLVSALFGAGFNQYQNAFTMYKPLEFNSSAFWNIKFASAGDYYLTLLTTGGVATLAAFIFLISRFTKTFRLRLSLNVARPTEMGLLIGALIAFVLFLVFPAANVSLFILFFTLGLLAAYYRLREVSAIANLSHNNIVSSPLAPVGALIIATIIFIGAVFYLVTHIFMADYNYYRSLQAAAQNKGADTYNYQIKAIDLNPFNDSYRATYSQTNLALADAIAATATPGAGLSETQRNNVVQLVQQAIREARTATALDPLKSSNWENLSTVYKSLVNFAQGADQWAVASENQAITLDPTNPRLRLDLGGMFLGFGQYNTAAQAFALATQLKPDYANAYYNLAQAYKLLKNVDFYKQNLTAAKNIVCFADANSADCVKISEEIASADKQAQAVTEAAKPAEESESNLATTSAKPTNLPKAKPSPVPTISSPSGELKQP